MKKQLLLIVSITTLFFSCNEVKNSTQTNVDIAQNVSSPEHSLNKPKLDSLFEGLSKNDQFMGSIALSHNGKTIYANAIGFDDIETKKTSTIDTKYRIGSISKTYTAVLIFKAIEEKKLTLDQTIETYFPTIENAKKITVANLLNHRSGIHSYTNDKAFLTYHTKYKTPKEMIEIISNYKSDFEPNSTSEYSNSNYILLSILLEKIYNSSFKNIIAEKICTPLNLKNTYYGSKINLENNECHSYKYEKEWTKQPESDMSIAMGAGAIVSTPDEVNKFMEALFTEKLISKQNIEKMTTIKDSYGMGISRFTISGREGFGHSGSLDGFKSLVVYFPKEKLSIALTANGANNNKNEILTQALGYYFNDTTIEISEADLKQYVGKYVSVDKKSDTFTFSQDKNKLILEISQEFKEPLIYKGEHNFLFEQVYAESFSFTFLPETKQLLVKQGDYEGIYNKE